jgi:hypothetical protein
LARVVFLNVVAVILDMLLIKKGPKSKQKAKPFLKKHKCKINK